MASIDQLRVCRQCEYFDAEFGDCLNRMSPRFQTEADSPACPAFFESSESAGESHDKAID